MLYDLSEFLSELTGSFPGILILLFIITWCILWIALPFYVYGVYNQTRQMRQRIDDIWSSYKSEESSNMISE